MPAQTSDSVSLTSALLSQKNVPFSRRVRRADAHRHAVSLSSLEGLGLGFLSWWFRSQTHKQPFGQAARELGRICSQPASS